MPVKRFRDYIKWKHDYEDEKQKLIKEEMDKIKGKK